MMTLCFWWFWTGPCLLGLGLATPPLRPCSSPVKHDSPKASQTRDNHHRTQIDDPEVEQNGNLRQRPRGRDASLRKVPNIPAMVKRRGERTTPNVLPVLDSAPPGEPTGGPDRMRRGGKRSSSVTLILVK
ncbi:hypothetical protein QBC33DRAFT_517620 [Phialemonium atrogriseum]|uniref:Secreted protein n=1 Tax=Phialemonium atrogriseum TaxID=1093897 RepID=A0AAJ0BUE8_9PEZI|nr:uncharacterized protein QBC33DRAFT_517620 [Phialemonium atrogriseum]KAK1764690.1 hypothetical protein QBC33DRAFT_517620 [Phialemonium atrogriseum]